MGPKPDINLTPMIDITLVILIILMVAIPVELSRMSVRVPGPKPTDPPPPPDDPQLVLAVYEDGSLALNREALAWDALQTELERQLRPREDKLVFVDADGDAPFERVVEAVDLAREAGGRVGLPRMKETGPLPVRPDGG